MRIKALLALVFIVVASLSAAAEEQAFAPWSDDPMLNPPYPNAAIFGFLLPKEEEGQPVCDIALL